MTSFEEWDTEHTRGSWGGKLSDFKVGLGHRRAQPSNPQQRIRSENRQSKRRLAREHDGFSQFAELVSLDDEDSCDESPDESDLLSDDDGEDDLSHSTEGDNQHSTFTPELAQELIDDMCAACGPAPSLDSVEEIHRKRIQQHDKWYMEVIDGIFTELSCHSERTMKASPFGHNTYRWLSANTSEASRASMCRVLLHPHVRSFRTRSALGNSNWDGLFNRLESFSLMDELSQIPSVIGTYFLHGQRRLGGALVHDMAYVGQASSLRKASQGQAGIQKRGKEHQSRIHEVKAMKLNNGPLQELKDSHRFNWVHRRISHEDIGQVTMTVLTVLPFPRCHMHQASLHIPYLLTMAETIDMILLGTTARYLSNRGSTEFGALWGHKLRSDRLPKPSFDGLNRALPIKQPQQKFGRLMTRVFWSPGEVTTFINVIRQHHTVVYRLKRPRSIDWDRLLSLLKQQGVHKTTTQASNLYDDLSQHPECGLLTLGTAAWQHRWDLVVKLKKFLEQKGLIDEPRSDDDIYYHVPSLEGELIQYDTLRKFLLGQRFTPSLGEFDFEAICRLLPALLHKEVWERIGDTAPEVVKFDIERDYEYLAARARQVVLYYARQGSERGRLGHEMSWSWTDLLRVWHQSRAQMLADDPMAKVRTSDQLVVDPALLGPPLEDLSNYEEADTEAEEAATEDWPSDALRYKTLVLSWPGYSSKPDLPHQTESLLRIKRFFGAPLAFGGSVSSFRILIHIMRDKHKRTFDESTDSDLLDLSDAEYWDCLYVGGLSPAWGFRNIAELKSRFGWVLDYIRAGVFPPEAALVREVLEEALAETLLRSNVHPYSHVGEFDAKKSLNPDLSPSWVEWLLRSYEALPAIQRCLKRRNIKMGHQWICSAYGILITHIWEESCHLRGKTFNIDEILPAIHPVAQMSRQHAKAPRKVKPKTNAQLMGGLSRKRRATGLVKHPKRAKIAHDANGQTSPEAAQSGRSEDAEIVAELDVTKTAIKNPRAKKRPVKRPAARKASLNKPVGSRFRTRKPEHVEPRRSSQEKDNICIRYSAEEDAFLISLLESEKSWTEIANDASSKFGRDRSGQSVKNRAKKLNPLAPRFLALRKCPRFDEEENAYLENLLETDLSWVEIGADMTDKFGVYRNYKSDKYTDEQDALLKHLLEIDKPWDEIIAELKDKFGVNRTHGALELRRKQLGFTINGPRETRNKRWTKEEDELLTMVCEEHATWAERFAAFQRLSKVSRPDSALRTRAGTMGLTTPKPHPWTEDEITFLKELKSKENSWEDILFQFHRRYGSIRTKASLSTRWRLLENAKLL
ncbi:Aminodeoxychorismate synthase [Fusarium albosuccineum]|uniref:Aminodeoxychorismate synthase n=1 Tax=Fusarium albosuccineum TaxID=1237068 RepID=A0A8H4PES7_9HYPO|nr:Aminodeoxychorismate synthase [Fusarium albosuccineum]